MYQVVTATLKARGRGCGIQSGQRISELDRLVGFVWYYQPAASTTLAAGGIQDRSTIQLDQNKQLQYGARFCQAA